MKKIFFLYILNIFLASWVRGQVAGEWRMHINYSNCIGIAVGKNSVLSANEKSVLFYHLDDNSIQTLDKVKGLSDYGVVGVSYDDSTETFIIAYQNSNIDLINGNTVINLPDIKNKITAGSKTINNLFSHNGFCYVSTDFGIVVLDLEFEEVDNT
ncbi:MAG: hypothetical protein LRY27_02265, partial [Chitinophagales bacterium]|nr:hypothetical protein [Chitinophagales bacterium]